MEWTDTGVLLTSRAHGEHAAIIDVLTPTHGRAAGVVRGGRSRKMTPHLQPGTQLDVTWKARLEDHLGSFTVEPVRARAAVIMGDRKALAGMQAVTALTSVLLPEREAMPDVYERTVTLLDLMAVTDAWPLAYLRWELGLLEALGYGLDLSRCAVTGATEGLNYVSPKSGRAVSTGGAGEWAPKLLPLPPVLLPGNEGDDGDIAQAMGTTGFFLSKAAGDGRDLPEARRRLRDVLAV
ncbi:DNA repair protein RecO [Shimia ponticola]|uniref:DNA repair protein RecO n=1 Tax=Shimia ponticola TaxID=2582893 RepID=UPI0011BF6990|nr:DNA repair protein RecO [Shimia ponticola]